MNYFIPMNLNFCPSDLSKIISVSILLPPSSASCLTAYFSLLLPTLNTKFIKGFSFPFISSFCFPYSVPLPFPLSIPTVLYPPLLWMSFLYFKSLLLCWYTNDLLTHCRTQNKCLFLGKVFLVRQTVSEHHDRQWCQSFYSSYKLWNTFCLISTFLIKYLFVRMVHVLL